MTDRRWRHIWMEQCDAAAGIRVGYGLKAAFDQAVGEELLHFAEAVVRHRDFVREMPRFVARVKSMFTAEDRAPHHRHLHEAARGDGAMNSNDASERRDRWARLRFAVVGPLLASPPPAGQLRAELERLAEREWEHPCGKGPVRFATSTIERWYYQARAADNDPVGALRVRDALVRQRALRADVLEACHRRGLLYADDRLNAVFVCRNASANPTGAEVLGTEPHTGTKRFRAMAPGSRKARGGFWLHCDRNRPALVILTESAVDTLSARSLRIEGTRESGAVVASTAGIASSVPSWIEQWKPKRIVCAYDADSAGDDAAERLAVSDPRVIRLRPRGAKDWNEILLRSR